MFSSLGLRAVNRATETMLQDRLTTAQLVADYLDEALGRALGEVTSTATILASDGAGNSFASHIQALENSFFRLSIQTVGIYLINERGYIIASKPEAPTLQAKLPPFQ